MNKSKEKGRYFYSPALLCIALRRPSSQALLHVPHWVSAERLPIWAWVKSPPKK
jgi:hypothetical protein